jgi:hypothetical protein
MKKKQSTKGHNENKLAPNWKAKVATSIEITFIWQTNQTRK